MFLDLFKVLDLYLKVLDLYSGVLPYICRFCIIFTGLDLYLNLRMYIWVLELIFWGLGLICWGLGLIISCKSCNLM